jgi:hypothetical protein
MTTVQNDASFQRVAWQDCRIDANAEFLERLGTGLQMVLPMLNEQVGRR